VASESISGADSDGSLGRRVRGRTRQLWRGGPAMGIHPPRRRRSLAVPLTRPPECGEQVFLTGIQNQLIRRGDGKRASAAVRSRIVTEHAAKPLRPQSCSRIRPALLEPALVSPRVPTGPHQKPLPRHWPRGCPVLPPPASPHRHSPPYPPDSCLESAERGTATTAVPLLSDPALTSRLSQCRQHLRAPTAILRGSRNPPRCLGT
jgi:hypothetical protein